MRSLFLLLVVALAEVLSIATASPAQTREIVSLRGRPQTLRLYGSRGGPPVVVSSGDGGWIHLAPHVAEILASRGFFVVGFDTRAYLAGFTSGATTLRTEDEPGDYLALIEFAARGSEQKPLLIGVSEGAGLSILATTDARVKTAAAGVIALGLPDLNELGWRWTDALIYLTHGTPHEPTFSAAGIVHAMAPLPLAAIHSTSDEFVPLGQVQHVLDQAREPKRLWLVTAGNHRFSDNLPEFDRRLLEAVSWIARRNAT